MNLTRYFCAAILLLLSTFAFSQERSKLSKPEKSAIKKESKDTTYSISSSNANHDGKVQSEASRRDMTIEDIDIMIAAIKKKMEIIEADPEEAERARKSGWYSQMNDKLRQLKTKKQKLLGTYTEDARPTPEGFPEYEKTGDPEQDQKNYEAAKKKWVEENPEKYREMTSSSVSKTQISEDEFKAMSQEKQQSIKNNPELYEIVK